MKNTTLKSICFLLLVLLSFDSYSQLVTKSRTGNGGTGGDPCHIVLNGDDYTYCQAFSFPVQNLQYDYTDWPSADCYPAVIFGCELHIGLTYENTGVTNYIPVTSCMAEAITNTNNDPTMTFIGYPEICVNFPIVDKFQKCIDGPFNFSLDLYCKDAFGNFTSISDIAATDTENSWSTVLPQGGPGLKTHIKKLSFTRGICCEPGLEAEGDVIGPADIVPLVGQDDNGSKAFVRNLVQANSAIITVFDANQQKVELNNAIYEISDTELEIDLYNLNSGVYFIRIIDNNAIYSGTIVKM